MSILRQICAQCFSRFVVQSSTGFSGKANWDAWFGSGVRLLSFSLSAVLNTNSQIFLRSVTMFLSAMSLGGPTICFYKIFQEIACLFQHHFDERWGPRQSRPLLLEERIPSMGTPHYHALLWIRDTPVISPDTVLFGSRRGLHAKFQTRNQPWIVLAS